MGRALSLPSALCGCALGAFGFGLAVLVGGVGLCFDVSPPQCFGSPLTNDSRGSQVFVLGQRLIVSFVCNDLIDSSHLSFASRKGGFSFIRKKATLQPLITNLPSKEPGLLVHHQTQTRGCTRNPCRSGRARAGRCRLMLKDLSDRGCGP